MMDRPRVARFFSKRRLVIAGAGLLALVALYALIGFYAAPPLIHRAIGSFATENLERKVTLGDVRVNPFLLTLELKDFALAERNGAPILGFKRLFVDFTLASITRRAWTFDDIALEEPALSVDIAPDGRLNLAALIEKLPKGKPDEKPPRLLLRRFAMSAGTITLSDRSGPTPGRAVVSPVTLELHELSTLHDERGTYSINARLADGGAFDWRGEVSLEPLASKGEIRFTGLKPLTAWRFLRDELAVEEPRGEVNFGGRYRFTVVNAVPHVTLEDIRLDGRGIAITAAGTKEPLLTLSSVSATGGKFDLATRELTLPALEIRDGSVTVEVDRDGTLNWTKLVVPEPARTAAQPAAAAKTKPWKARVEALKVAGLGLRYLDQSRKQPLAAVVKDISIELGASATIQPDGTQALVEGIAVTLTGLAAGAPGKEPLASFDTVTLAGGTVDLGERRFSAERVAIAGGLLKMARDERGAVGAMAFLAADDTGALRREVKGATQRAREEGRPWSIGVDAFDASGVRIGLTDSSFGETIALDAELKARLAGYHSDGKNPVKLDARIRFAQGGTVTAAGNLRTSGEEVSGTFKVEGFDLKPLRPLLMRHLRADLASGAASADIRTQYRLRKGRHELRATGQARVDNLRINERNGSEQLVGWKSLAATGMRFSLAPDELNIDEVRIAGVGAKVIIFKDRKVNLMQVVARDTPAPAAETAKPVAVAAPQPAASADDEPQFPVKVGRVAFDGGVVDFADLSLVLPFAAKIHELTGAVQGLGTDRDARALVRLEGRVDEFGLARAEGSLRPFKPTSFMDLTVSFRNVDMPPLSAYSATFAGRRINSGRLALDLHYKINNGVLAGENKVVLEKFTLGERVEAPGALNLPLDLAVALLTDSEGKIALAVPVSGNVDDPKFSYGDAIWHAIGNVLTRIVTAPFRALAAVFGGGSGEKDPENIAFDPGRATLTPPEQEKLKRVAEALGKRPQLRVVAEGQYGTADRTALRTREVEAAVAAKLGRTATVGGVPDAVNVTDAKTQRALEALFVERHSEPALDAFVAQTEKSRGRPVSRANAALVLVGRGSADSEFYEALLKRLVETAPVPDAALAQLATSRAETVAQHLTGPLNMPAGRVAVRNTTASGAPQVKLGLEAGPAAQ